tara:strand:- start:102 stop:782 length:681 start_codon:yes stop_codon:yes gene_type:complete
MNDISGSRFLKMAGSDGFQRDLNKAATPTGTPGSSIGGDFGRMPVEGSDGGLITPPVSGLIKNPGLPAGGTGPSGSFDYSMFSSPDNNSPSSLQGPGSFEGQVSRDKDVRSSGFTGSQIAGSPSAPAYSQTVDRGDGSNIAMKYIQMGQASQSVDIAGLDQRIHQRPMYHEAKSKLEGLKTYGDSARWSKENIVPFQRPEPMKGVEKPDFEGMYNRSKSDLNELEL